MLEASCYSSQPTTTQGGGGGQTSNPPSVPPKQPKKGAFSCASEAASNVSLAGALQHFDIGTSGFSGFVTNALAGNAFSGASDLVQSIGNGEAGGHSVFYNMGQGIAAGPSQGFGAAFPSLEHTPWTSGPADVTTTAIVAKGFSLATGAGESIQTLNGVTQLGSFGLEAAEFATGVGEAKLAYDFVTYAGALAGCGTGLID